MGSYNGPSNAAKARRGLTRNSIRDGEVMGRKLHADVASGAWMLYKGKGQPLLFLADLSGVAAGTDNVRAVAALPGGHHLYFTPIGTVTNAPYGPTASTLGLDLSLDQTDDEGVNYDFGYDTGPFVMTIERTAGQEAAVEQGRFIRLRCKIPDVAGTDDFAVGFRKVEAVQAAIDSYDEMAAINVISGDVYTETILNNAGTVPVDSTSNWANNETHEIEVRVTGNGKVTFRLDGADLPITQPFQFDDAEVIQPFIYFLQAAGLTPVHIVELEVGSLEQV
jgi:hypothetical protein